MMFRLALYIALILPCLIVGAWWDDSWGYRFSITSDAGEVDEDTGVYSFPLSDAPSEFWDEVKSAGADIRITDDSEAQVPFEIVGFDGTADTGRVIFKDAGSTSADTTWWIYYGNAAASALSAGDTYGAEAVWTDHDLVLHMQETGGTTAVDSTSNDNDFTSNGTMTSGDNIAGPTNDWVALDFDGTDDYLSATTSNMDSSSFTISTWLRKKGSGATYIFCSGPDFTIGNRITRVYDVNFGGKFRFQPYVTFSGAEAQWRHDTSGEFPANDVWFKLDMTYDGSSTSNDPLLYVDGVATTALGENITPSGTMDTGADSYTVGARIDSSNPWDGYVAGLTWSDTVRSANYIATMFSMENDPGTFWDVGAQETDSTTGFITGSSAATFSSDDYSWSNLNNLLTDDSNVATATSSGREVADEIKISFAHSVPTGATVDRIEMKVRWRSDGSSHIDSRIQLVKIATTVGTNRSDGSTIPSTNQTKTWGTSSDALWGTTWTAAEVNAATFSFVIGVEDDDSGSDSINIEAVFSQITFTPSGGGPSQTDLSRGFFAGAP